MRRSAPPAAPSRPDRRSPLRARRRKTRALIALGCTVLFAAGAYGIHWVSYLPQYSISSVAVAGTQELSPQLVRTFVAAHLTPSTRPFLSPQNMFLYDPAGLARAIAAFFPRVASADVSRASMLATAITVTVRERQPFANWCSGDECFVMDEEGFIFGSARGENIPPSSGYTFTGAVATSTGAVGHYFARGHLPGLLALLRLLGQAGFSPQGARIEDDHDFSVLLSEGFALRASFGQDAGALARDLKLVLSSDALSGKVSELEYVDLRFGDRVYFKLKGKDVSRSNAH